MKISIERSTSDVRPTATPVPRGAPQGGGMNRRGFLNAGATLGVLAVVPTKAAQGETPEGAYAEVYNVANQFVGRVGLSVVDGARGFTMHYAFNAVRAESIASVKAHLPRTALWARGVKLSEWDAAAEKDLGFPIHVITGDSICFTHAIHIHK